MRLPHGGSRAFGWMCFRWACRMTFPLRLRKGRLVFAWGLGSLGKEQRLNHKGHRGTQRNMGLIDRACAGTLFVLAIVECLLVPKTYTGRIWLLGTDLALLFTGMLNVLRIRNGYGVQGLRMFCIAANLTMLVFAAALMMSIGQVRTLANPQIVLVAGLLAVETVFSLGKNA